MDAYERENILIKNCKQGDSKAQAELFNSYAPKMLGVCMRYTSNRSEAEDMLQDSFVKVFLNIDKFESEFQGGLAAWIRRICVNTALNYIRKNQNLKFDSISDVQLAEADDDADLELGPEVKKEDLLNLIAQLPSGYKLVFNLYVFEQYTHQQIAEELKISVNTSKSQLSKARAYLKRALLNLKPKQSISLVL